MLAFHNNYGPILYHFRDKAKYWSKIAIFFIPHLHSTPPSAGTGFPRNIAIGFGRLVGEKLEWLGSPMLKEV